MFCLNVGEKPLECIEAPQLELQIFHQTTPPLASISFHELSTSDPLTALHLEKIIQSRKLLGAERGALLAADLWLPDSLKIYLGIGEKDNPLAGFFFSWDFF